MIYRVEEWIMLKVVEVSAEALSDSGSSALVAAIEPSPAARWGPSHLQLQQLQQLSLSRSLSRLVPGLR